MKNLTKIALLLLLFMSAAYLPAQTAVAEPSQLPTAPFRLYRTTNLWTFLKLETATGRLWQLQFDVQGDNRGSIVLSTQDLSGGKGEPGRFTLYPTSNMYTFILVDQSDGRTWQVQWSIDRDGRFVIPIY